MTAKKYLMQLKRIDTLLRQIENEIQNLESGLFNTSVSPKEVNVISSGPKDPYGDVIVRITMLQEKYSHEWDKLIALREKIVGQIQAMTNPLQMQILYKRYVEYKGWEKIFKEIRKDNPEYTYSDRQLFRIHGIALMEFAKRVSECQY